MALNNYGRALGQLATESVKGSVKGFAMGIKGAAMSEMPGLTALMGLSREVKGRAAIIWTGVLIVIGTV